MKFETRKGVALFGGGRLEQLGFAQTIRADPDGIGFEVVDMLDKRADLQLSAVSKDVVDVSQIAIILGETGTASEAEEIAQLMTKLAPRASILAVREETAALHPRDWPNNLRGIVGWNDLSERLFTVLALVNAGLEIFDPKLTDLTHGPHSAPSSATPPPKHVVTSSLTHREEEVAAQIACGAQNRCIAGKLGIAVNTVNTHVNSLMRKLGVNNRTEIAIWYHTAMK
ncbi:helix-turn-helix transcriptional regulator [Sulfitobacter guttiformis]|nr:LuxR C-terminal-related transcriptional regulator [Sulfitobacter guttiformis]